MTSVKLKLHKNKLLKDGTYPLVFQIIHNRRKKVLYTNYKIRESDFDPVSGKVRADDSRQLSDRSAQRMNRALNRERKTLLSKIAFYEEHGIDFCVEDLDNRSSRQHNVHLLQYMNKQIREKILARRNGTAAAYKSTHSSLQKYLGGKDVRASEINPMFVRKYEEFLRKQQVSDNTIAFYMRNLRTIYNNILQDGFPSVGESPFKATRTTVHKTVKRALSKKNMVLLVHCTFSPSEPLLEFARDIFLFSFYTRGMSLVDIVFLRKEHIFDNAIHYVRHKSSQPLRITITEPLAALIAKYDNDSPYIFPILRDNVFALRPVPQRTGPDQPQSEKSRLKTRPDHTPYHLCGTPHMGDPGKTMRRSGCSHQRRVGTCLGENHAYLPERIRQRRTGSNKRNCDPFIANFQGPEKFSPIVFIKKTARYCIFSNKNSYIYYCKITSSISNRETHKVIF